MVSSLALLVEIFVGLASAVLCGFFCFGCVLQAAGSYFRRGSRGISDEIFRIFVSMIFVFPGQGSQCVGMGREVFSAFPSARAVFLEVDEALGENFSRRLFHGPQAFLTRTENAQPGLFAVCMAIFRSLEAEFGISLSVGSFAAGHSLGEYTALAAVGSLGISDGARLLRLRGRLMQSAVGEGCGAMVAILGLDWNGAVALAEEASRLSGEVCEATNDNSMHQVVLGGTRSGISRACALARAFGARRVIPLSVSAPFHCSLMSGCEGPMREALSEVCFRSPELPVISNVTARPLCDSAYISDMLVRQICAPVRWRESMQFFASVGGRSLLELGPGKTLCNLARGVIRACTSASTPEDLERVATFLSSR